jgi:hypothetical protein
MVPFQNYIRQPCPPKKMVAIAKNRRLTFIFLSDFDAVFSLDSLLNYLSVVCQRIWLCTESSIYLAIIMAFLFWGATLSQVSDYRLLGASSILSFYYYYRVDTSASPVPPWYHLPSSQCFSTDMVYYIYLLLKFTDLK